MHKFRNSMKQSAKEKTTNEILSINREKKNNVDAK